MSTVGIIGLRNHAYRLRCLLEPIASVTKLYHPTRIIDDPRSTQELDDLMSCDAIVIASPNDTHYSYLMQLADYDGYILCEKPVSVVPDDLVRLETHGPDPERVMINYTYRHSQLAGAIEQAIRSGSLGDLIGFSGVLSNGLAFKPSYPGSWRATDRYSVIETLGVHLVDLMIWACNVTGHDGVSTIEQRSRTLSVGPAYDTSRIIVKMASGVTGDILVSYAMPFMVEVSIVGTNGTLHARDGNIVVRSPRDTFDERGLFITPPDAISMPYDAERMYEDALRVAIERFIAVVDNRRLFDRHRYETCWAMSALVRRKC